MKEKCGIFPHQRLIRLCGLFIVGLTVYPFICINDQSYTFGPSRISHVPSLRQPPNTSAYILANETKIIYGATEIWQGLQWSDILNFDGCRYSNCICRNSTRFEGVEDARIVIFAKVKYTKVLPRVPSVVRQHQYWFMMSIESGFYHNHQFPPRFNNVFNGSIMYRTDATIRYPYGRAYARTKPLSNLDFCSGKTRGAFAYVSRCATAGYRRLGIMNILSNYINVDIFSDRCHGPHISHSPCPRLKTGSNVDCEKTAHQNYRFYLSFENSLCKDYITEKFWDRLQSESYFVPVALGGLSVEEYSTVAPPNSFLHVYNFTSVHTLGEYLKYLMHNDMAYSKYHQWRYQYHINTQRSMPACELCRIANEMPYLPVVPDIAEWRNNASTCREYNF